MAKRVTGIGGIFFKSNDPAKLGAWYAKHLELDIQPDFPGWVFQWRQADNPEREGMTIWSLHERASDYFGSDDAQFMINYIVEDLDAVMAALKAEGVEILREVQDTPYGRFAAIKDPEGNGIELWQPPDDEGSSGDDASE
jgi:predicted enzyme related to lactoylglutathione lyase